MTCQVTEIQPSSVAHALPNALGPTETWEAARPPRACRLACRARNEKRDALLAALGDVGRQNRADTPEYFEYFELEN